LIGHSEEEEHQERSEKESALVPVLVPVPEAYYSGCTSSQRIRDPEFLDGSEFQALIGKLNQQARVMVLLAGSTGMEARRTDRASLVRP